MSFKTLFATIVKRDLDYERVDIVTAFLNSLLREDVYVEAPEAYREEGYVWFLKRAIYGLKQSPREWDSTIKKWHYHKTSTTSTPATLSSSIGRSASLSLPTSIIY
jgi:hypothetical protein